MNYKKSYTWDEINALHPKLIDNKLIIILNNITYEARRGANEKWYLHEIHSW
jgi:hypothetical protein